MGVSENGGQPKMEGLLHITMYISMINGGWPGHPYFEKHPYNIICLLNEGGCCRQLFYSEQHLLGHLHTCRQCLHRQPEIQRVVKVCYFGKSAIYPLAGWKKTFKTMPRNLRLSSCCGGFEEQGFGGSSASPSQSDGGFDGGGRGFSEDSSARQFFGVGGPPSKAFLKTLERPAEESAAMASNSKSDRLSARCILCGLRKTLNSCRQ